MSKYERIKSSENKNYRYRTTVFIICLLVSALLWLTIKFSSDYTVEIPYSISLKGIPEGKVLVNQPDSVLRINVKASGYALLKCRYLSRHDSYEVNVSQWIGRISAGTSDATINTLLIAQHIKEERSLPGIIEFVSPEELSLKFDRGVSKQVPIIPDVSYSCILYTSDAADDPLCVDHGGHVITQKKRYNFHFLFSTILHISKTHLGWAYLRLHHLQ